MDADNLEMFNKACELLTTIEEAKEFGLEAEVVVGILSKLTDGMSEKDFEKLCYESYIEWIK